MAKIELKQLLTDDIELRLYEIDLEKCLNDYYQNQEDEFMKNIPLELPNSPKTYVSRITLQTDDIKSFAECKSSKDPENLSCTMIKTYDEEFYIADMTYDEFKVLYETSILEDENTESKNIKED